MVLANARIHTFASPTVVPAVAIRDGQVVAIGSALECASAAGEEARVLDLGGRVVLPGFIDAHLHWAGYALFRLQLPLSPDEGLVQIRARVAERVKRAEPGEWIVGRGWDHADWGRWPSIEDLDDIAPAHPVALVRKDGHAMWVNSRALLEAGIDANTPSPAGGLIERTGGRPNGILKEAALQQIRRVTPEPSEAELRDAMAEAWPDAWRYGITGVHDMGFGTQSIHGALEALRNEGRLGLRMVFYAPSEALESVIDAGLRSGDGDSWLRVGGLKLFLDGTLGSRTAHMLAPFDDALPSEPGLGIQIIDPEALADLVERAASAGLATAVHAIGDAANRTALDAFEAVGDWRSADGSRLRHRIEHAQLLAPEDIPRFRALGVIASMQPIHATADYEVARIAWGERSVGSYAWRGLIDSGAMVAFGSDAPIETMDVFAGIHAAITRQRASGEPEGGFRSEQRIRIDESLLAYTRNAAWSGGQDGDLGCLVPGRCADLVVLDADPFETDSQQMHALGILATMIDGRWVWGARGSESLGIEPPA